MAEMLVLTTAVTNESTAEEIREANHEMWAYRYDKWTWKNGLLPFDPTTLQKLDAVEEPELSRAWRIAETETMRAWSDIRSSWSNQFDWNIGSWGETSSVASEKARMAEHLENRRAKEDNAMRLTVELEQLEQGGARQARDEYDNLRWAISNYNDAIDDLVRINEKIAAKLEEVAAKKAERKAARLAKKAEQVA